MADEIIVPIFDPNRGFRLWNRNEIFTGTGIGKYVPNLNDMVLDWDLGYFRVVGLDMSTGLSTLEEWSGPKESVAINSEGVLLGVDIGAQGESYRVYIDTSVTPHTLACDSRLHIFGSGATSVKIFEGTDISDEGKVISAMYDTNDTFLGENIPLELVLMPDANNTAIKTPVVGFTLRQLDDGDVVTAVVYNDLGYAISYSTLLVKNTSFIRTTEANRKYVSSIHLESPYMDISNDRTLTFPVNMTIDEIPARGVVTYSDGTVVKMPINSERFKLFGLDHFVATIVGQKVPLVLTYILGDGEYCYGSNTGGANHISEKYWGTTTAYEKSYSIKLFMYPEWIDEINGYRLRYYLVTLDRSKVYEVTDLVVPTNVSGVFSPLGYGVKQKLSVSIDMSKVDVCYPEYTLVQTFEVSLLAPGTDTTKNWLVNFSSGQETPYGDGLAAKARFVNADLWYLDISNGFNSLEEWARNVFYASEPLFNPEVEERAPLPNILNIKTARRSFEISINDWDNEISFINDLAQGQNLVIEFIHRVYENDIIVGVIALPVHFVN